MSEEIPVVTAKVLEKAFYKTWFGRYDLLVPNAYLVHNSESDIVAVRHNSNYLDEIEIKLTRSDFLADFKKNIRIFEAPNDPNYRNSKVVNKHEALQNGLATPNYFSFLFPMELLMDLQPNLISEWDLPHDFDVHLEEPIPSWAGVMYLKGNKVVECRKAKQLHKGKASQALKYKLCKKMMYRYWQ